MFLVRTQSIRTNLAETDGAELRSMLFGPEPRVVQLSDFLPSDVAYCVAAEFERIDYYRRSLMLRIPTHEYDISARIWEVDEPVWRDSQEEYRFWSQDLAQPLTRIFETDLQYAKSLIRHLGGSDFRRIIADICGEAVDGSVGCEVARYRYGDFIAPHTDLFPGRRLSLNLYLDPQIGAADGGNLRFASFMGREQIVSPFFNSVSIFAPHEGYFHEVTPYAGRSPGRYALCMSFSVRAEVLP
jgi:hypothetical protein